METKYPLPDIKYLPGARVCFIKGEMIVMARVTCTFFDTRARTFRFKLDKFAKEFTEDELYFNFHDAQQFMDGKSDDG